jgi:hypothetical protein
VKPREPSLRIERQQRVLAALPRLVVRLGDPPAAALPQRAGHELLRHHAVRQFEDTRVLERLDADIRRLPGEDRAVGTDRSALGAEVSHVAPTALACVVHAEQPSLNEADPGRGVAGPHGR